MKLNWQNSSNVKEEYSIFVPSTDKKIIGKESIIMT